MSKTDRQSIILNELRQQNSVRSAHLCNILEVSEDTIRRDLEELEKKGHLKKVRGGAAIHSFIPGFKKREMIEIETKYCMAQKALSLIEDGQVLIIDGGTSNLQLVSLIPLDMKLTIFTNSIPLASKLCEFPNIDSVLVGGNILRNGHATIGYQALESLQEIHADLCFLGITSVDIEHGLTEANRQETSIKKAIISSSNRIASMVISNKLNTRQPFKVCGIEKLDVMVTDLDPDDEQLETYCNKGLKLV